MVDQIITKTMINLFNGDCLEIMKDIPDNSIKTWINMKKDLIYDNQQTLFGAREIIGFGSDDWHVKEIDRKLANKLIVKNHY